MEEYSSIREKDYEKISIHFGDEKCWESKLFYKAKGFIETEPDIMERKLDAPWDPKLNSV
ncbi:MAG: hypothetical protein J5736_03495 [Bacilli bacterium]|nr:hypothetical protein [Bacilli bacterium]